MNKKAQNDIAKIFELIIAVIFLLAVLPIFFQLSSLTSPEPQEIINNTAVEQAKNLSLSLEICQQNYEQLKNSTVTKEDFSYLVSVVSQLNQNVINIYETNHNYIKNYFSLTIILSITLTLAFTIGLFTLLDLTIFKAKFMKTGINIIKQRFSYNQEVVNIENVTHRT
jgi:hypothetical protein